MTEEQQRVTSVSSWRSTREGTTLELPSGNVALVRNPGPEHFLRSGMIPDPLTGVIRQAIAGGGGEDALDGLGEKMAGSEDGLEETFRMIDTILCAVVVEPEVRVPPEDEDGNFLPFSEREDQEVLYADEVDMSDKMFIFQFAMGGVRDLETFREEQKQSVEALSGRQEMEGSSE